MKPHYSLSVFLALLTASFLLGTSGFAQSPRVDSIEPTQGPIVGGTMVTIRGANFAGATVLVDNISITPIAIFDTEIRLQTPPHDNGYALIKIRNAGGTGYAEFLYMPPTLDEIAPGYITTIAGGGNFAGDGRLATQAKVETDQFVYDASGNLYFVEQEQHRVRRVRVDGIIETYAGTGVKGRPISGQPATETDIGLPKGVALDSTGNLYIAEIHDHRIWRVDATNQIITLIAGTGYPPGFSGDGGPALNAQFNSPTKIAIDNVGTLFVLDVGNLRIRRIAPDGIVSTFAGTGVRGFSGDGGPATQAQIDPGVIDGGGLAVDAQGNVYYADTDNGRIRKIDRQTGIINTVVTRAFQTRGVFVDALGNLYFAINAPNEARIFKRRANGEITATHGRGYGFSPDGTPASNAPLGFIDDLHVDQAGNITFTDISIRRVRRINAQTGLLETVAGIGPSIINETGPALATVLNNFESDLLFLPNGDLLFFDGWHNRLRKIDAHGNISTVAGTGFLDFGNIEGPAHEVYLAVVRGLELESDGSILLADPIIIRRLDTSGMIHCIACTPGHSFTGDGGPAREATFCGIHDIALDDAENIYIADAFNMRIRRIDAQTGIITTFAGSGPTFGPEMWGMGEFCGDGGPALSACLDTPLGVAVDKQGNLFINDGWFDNPRIRKVDTSGTINTFFITSSAATKIVFDAAGNLYTVDKYLLYKISPDGVIRTILGGSGPFGFSGDGGPALDALFHAEGQSTGIAIDEKGNLFFADGENRRIRVIKFGAIVAPPNATMEVIGGNNQSVVAGMRLGTPLEVTVRDEVGNPGFGVRVDFTAPSSGPSLVFPNGSNVFSVITDRFGKAQAVVFANCEAGAYTVIATPLGSSATANFTLTNTANSSGNPTAIFGSLLPSSASAGGSGFSLQVNGSNFLPCSVVRWNGSDRTTTFLSDSQLTASISASDIDSAGTAEVTVFNPAPGGGISNAIAFSIILAPPKLASPPDSSTGISTTPILIWNASPSATAYRLQVANDSSFSTIFFEDSTITTTSRQVGPLAKNATYFWRVSAKAASARSVYSTVWRFTTEGTTSVEQIGKEVPRQYDLRQNYPNPFNPFTTIEFALPKSGHVTLTVFNSLGQRVQTLVSQHLLPGRYRTRWDASNFPNGLYFYRLQAGSFVQIKKMVAVK